MPASAPVWDFDYEDDFLIVDGLETVELRRQTSAGGFAAAVDVRAVRESPNKKTVAGQMEAADIVFHLFAADVGADEVRPGDKITDHAGRSFTVGAASLGGIFDQWRCPAVRLPS